MGDFGTNINFEKIDIFWIYVSSGLVWELMTVI